jgi:hypothetical protein
VNADGGIKRNNYVEMINTVKKRKEYSRNGSSQKYDHIPHVNDALFGKGGPSKDRPGNIGLKMTVKELLSLYDTLDKAGKMELGKQVVEAVKVGGGQFLSKVFGIWMEVPEEMARSKVATLFQNRRKAARKALKKEAAIKTSSSEICFEDGQGSGKRARVKEGDMLL